MLVLSRKRGETIVVGENIEVSILEVQGNRVRLGFKAPAEVRIRREELPPEEPHAVLAASVSQPTLACSARVTGDAVCPALLRRPRFVAKPR